MTILSYYRAAWPLRFMLIDEHITAYLHSLDTDLSPELSALRKEAEEASVPLIRREMERFLCVLLQMKQPERILEIGTGIGYSAALMAASCDSIRRIDTIENYPPRIAQAEKTFASMQQKAEIRLLAGDVQEVLPTLDATYDWIFLDGPKGQYLSLLPDLMRLLNDGGVLLADNVLQGGELVRSRFVTERRDRTIHDRMREFLYTVTHHPLLTTSVLTVGDGVSLSIKKKADPADAETR